MNPIARDLYQELFKAARDSPNQAECCLGRLKLLLGQLSGRKYDPPVLAHSRDALRVPTLTTKASASGRPGSADIRKPARLSHHLPWLVLPVAPWSYCSSLDKGGHAMISKDAKQFLREQAERGVPKGDRSVMEIFLLLADIERDGLDKALESRRAEDRDRLIETARGVWVQYRSIGMPSRCQAQ